MYDRRGDFGSPDASTTVKGKVELVTSAELQAALAAAAPDAAVEDNVVTLQAMYARRGDFGPKHTVQTAAPTPQQIAAAAVGDIWLVYTP